MRARFGGRFDDDHVVARTGRAGTPLSPPFATPQPMGVVYRVWDLARQAALSDADTPPPWPGGPTTCATPRSRSGSTSASPPPRSPSGPDTASTSSSGSMPPASSARTKPTRRRIQAVLEYVPPDARTLLARLRAPKLRHHFGTNSRRTPVLAGHCRTEAEGPRTGVSAGQGPFCARGGRSRIRTLVAFATDLQSGCPARLTCGYVTSTTTSARIRHIGRRPCGRGEGRPS